MFLHGPFLWSILIIFLRLHFVLRNSHPNIGRRRSLNNLWSDIEMSKCFIYQPLFVWKFMIKTKNGLKGSKPLLFRRFNDCDSETLITLSPGFMYTSSFLLHFPCFSEFSSFAICFGRRLSGVPPEGCCRRWNGWCLMFKNYDFLSLQNE